MNEDRKTNQQTDNRFDTAPDNLDRILLTEDTLLPSSGFTASVMEAIHERAAAPSSMSDPIPFPWKRAIPGVAALAIAIAILVRLIVTTLRSADSTAQIAWPIAWPAWLHLNLSFNSSVDWSRFLRVQAGPALLALAGSWACVAVCRRLAAGRPIR
jgi:hypothetical protein